MLELPGMTDLPYRPGDIIMVPGPGGYVLGRIVEPKTMGPWWQYLESVGNREDAMRRATDLARAAHTRAWLTDGEVTEIPVAD